MRIIFLGTLAILACIFGAPRASAKTHGQLIKHTHHLLPLTHHAGSWAVRALRVRPVKTISIIPPA